MYTSWTAFTINVFLYNDHPEDGLFGLKHAGLSHPKKYIWLLGPLLYYILYSHSSGQNMDNVNLDIVFLFFRSVLHFCGN